LLFKAPRYRLNPSWYVTNLRSLPAREHWIRLAIVWLVIFDFIKNMVHKSVLIYIFNSLLTSDKHYFNWKLKLRVNIESLYSFRYCTIILMFIDKSDNPVYLSNLYRDEYSISSLFFEVIALVWIQRGESLL
jgi:hypothetical protein